MKKEKKKLPLVILLSFLMIFTIVLLTSYAIWRVTKKQTGTNLVTGGCLDIEYNEAIRDGQIVGGFTSNKAWPITDSEGESDEGYYFSVTNTCDKEVDYEIVLESLETAHPDKHMPGQFIRVKLDNKAITKYANYELVKNDPDADYLSNILETRKIHAETIGPHETIEHVIKTWIGEDAPESTIGFEFSSKIKIYAGQGITIPNGEIAYTPEDCFTINDEGVLLTYDIDRCGTDLVIPPIINGVLVKNISSIILKERAAELTNLDISNLYGLEAIRDNTFRYYVGTDKELIIPDNVTSVGSNAFFEFNGTNLILGNSIEIIKNHAFWNFVGAGSELKMPNSLKTLEKYAFMSFNGSSLILNDGLETIAQSSFTNYQGLNQALIIPDSVTTIGRDAFLSFNGSNLVLSSNLVDLDALAFRDYVGTGQDLVIPDGVETLKTNVFLNFNGRSLTLPANLKTIDGTTFSNYVGDNVDLYIPSGVNYIGDGAFNRKAANTNIIFERADLNGVEIGIGRALGYANVKCMDNWSIIDCPN